MHTIRYVFYFLIISSSVFFSSCKKGEDKIKPLISIDLPDENQHISSLDTVAFEGMVTDNLKLEKISVALKNEDDVKVLEDEAFVPESKEYRLKFSYILDDIHLPGGKYYFHVKASDGVNVSNEFIYVNINMVPKELEKVFFATASSGLVKVFETHPEQFSSTFFVQQQGDYLGMRANSYQQQLYLGGSETGKLSAYYASDAAPAWSENNSSSIGVPWFTCLSSWEKGCFSGLYSDEFLRQLNGEGTPEFTAYAIAGHYFTDALLLQDHVVTVQRDKNAASTKIGVYYGGSGSLMQQLDIGDKQVAGMFLLEEDRLLLFMNGGGQADLEIYYTDGNYIWSPHALDPFPVEAVEQVSEQVFVFSQGNELKKYNAATNTLLTYKSGEYARDIEYDEVDDRLYICRGTDLKILDYSTGATLNTLSKSDTIRAVSILYNRE